MRKGRRYIHIIFFAIALLAGSGARAQIDEESDTSLDTVAISNNDFAADTGFTQPVQVRAIADSAVRRVQNNDAYWYANLPPEKKQPPKPRQTSFLENKSFGKFIWVLIIIAFVGVVIWYLASSNVRLFRKGAKRDKGEGKQEEAEDIFSLDYDRNIREAIAAGDYRQAIRLLYLNTLKDLSSRELIAYTQERTNSDYLYQLSNTTYYRPFFRLTRSFEYAWYGRLLISPEAFAQAQQEFADFKRLLSS